MGLGGAAGWLMRGLEVTEEGRECDAWIETPSSSSPAGTPQNPYQAHQDFLNTFRVYSTYGLTTTTTLPILLDTRQVDGPYTSLYASVFSSSHRLMDIRQLRDTVRSRGRVERLCVRRAVWGVHGGISPLARNGGRKEECWGSALLKAFRGFVEDRVREAVGEARGEVGESEVGDEMERVRGGDVEGKGMLERGPPLPLPVFMTKGTPRTLRVTYAIRNATTMANPMVTEMEKRILKGGEGFIDVTVRKGDNVLKDEEEGFTDVTVRKGDTVLEGGEKGFTDVTVKKRDTWSPLPPLNISSEHKIWFPSFMSPPPPPSHPPRQPRRTVSNARLTMTFK
ncbi:hypothetical protein BC829DRAFT_481304 [Chytridium lagenaria]|nr:hypothetical protein BC829DRAFT_481304 [Chytridium lagenaria]